MSLYQKLRPDTFDKIVGNESTVSALQAHFAQPRDKWSHCFLLSGPSGCAKTTIANIIAYEMLGGDDITVLDTSSFPNRFGVDAMRDVLDRIQFMPIGGSPWVVLIDEAHKLSRDSKGAMLIPTENCPDNVYYILTTTNVDQMTKDDEGKALFTRMSKFVVESLDTQTIFRYLRSVSRREGGKHIPDPLIEYIAEVSQGSMRQALVDLEKIIPLTDENEMRRNITGSCVEESGTMRDFFKCFLDQKNWKDVAPILKDLRKEEPERIRLATLAYFSTILLAGGNNAKIAALVIEHFSKNTYETGFSGILLPSWKLLGD